MSYVADDTLLSRVLEAEREAGKRQVMAWRKEAPGWGTLKRDREWVSRVDMESEDALREALGRLVPEASFYGEERGGSLDADLVWIVDPLDGTVNFLSGLDWFAISVALVSEGQTILGAVYRPVTDEDYLALRGGGARYRGGLLPKARRLPLSDALVATGTPFRSPDLAPAFFESAARVLPECRDIRRLGAAALDLCEVAAGRLQGFWESDLEPYDVAAALLMLKECGCPAYDASGAPYRPGSSRLVVTGWPGAAERLLEIVGPAYRARILS